MRALTIILFSTLIQTTLLAGVGTADEPSPASRWSQLLTRLLDARQKSYSGEVTFEGQVGSEFVDYPPFLARHEGTLTYDLRTASFFYEHTRECRVRVLAPGDHSLPDPDQVAPLYPVRHLCCRNPDYLCTWTQSSPNSSSGVSIRPPDYAPHDQACKSFPIDPLAVGLTEYQEWKVGKDAAAVHEYWRTLEVTDFQEEDGRAVVSLANPGGRFTVTVDLDRMVPLSAESTTPDGIFHYRSEAKWESIDDVWVPVSFFWSLDVESEPYTGREWGEYTFTWSRLNDDFPPELFTYASFGELPFGTNDVHDTRGPETEYIGHLQPDGSLVDMYTPPEKLPTAQPLEVRSERRWIWLVWGNLAAIVVLVVAYARRRHA
ncbi:hypothetical protein Mal4_51730 [Maioricimonas rarisocia]|uniref:Uncharacterized protein n=1 Tax=Maioricimonas rarisocia TaxID=2528026 RepID=A0A517ZEA3_9PLAN|nr:hypothetical protein [Maioricimonas rarisocia]QDU40813.1 hypothetical protein Mal4_51730 [Maioricimonas rarisocia]